MPRDDNYQVLWTVLTLGDLETVLGWHDLLVAEVGSLPDGSESLVARLRADVEQLRVQVERGREYREARDA